MIDCVKDDQRRKEDRLEVGNGIKERRTFFYSFVIVFIETRNTHKHLMVKYNGEDSSVQFMSYMTR